jgi:hypothetical protein
MSASFVLAAAESRSGTGFNIFGNTVTVKIAGRDTGGDEPPPAVTASALLRPDVVKGAHHRVADAVTTNTYFHEFSLVARRVSLSSSWSLGRPSSWSTNTRECCDGISKRLPHTLQVTSSSMRSR